MVKYILKRLGLMIFTFFVIITISFFLIRLLPQEMPQEANLQALIRARWEALGYNKPIIVQYGIYLKTFLLSLILVHLGRFRLLNLLLK